MVLRLFGFYLCLSNMDKRNKKLTMVLGNVVHFFKWNSKNVNYIYNKFRHLKCTICLFKKCGKNKYLGT